MLSHWRMSLATAGREECKAKSRKNTLDGGLRQFQCSILETPYYTPYKKQVLQKSSLQLFMVIFSASSATSMKESSGSPSSSSSIQNLRLLSRLLSITMACQRILMARDP
ncbi:hypothetical protein VNO77_32198 [Canavalia gladiata]|uniref:Uncharacterized protein n=1 Tax=Canavalia gladiata TaxID=3824 RepID=A0AAN9KRN6_CANGL